ncbi:uncharacterized protein NFIA_053330 [Aspergillus fischeri NRRL 181]|uniref:Uncharacterized protein n=1 Tax=Neosartorya fischeri (strain ATCC 1020 / DSM 3700 / CBS 544.65 / FGSC A1164 / JCM 1740 / NRRL 181 / WB 181) TaxID=331117 RepID=A1DMG6_NEOFI|nr:conserved hypothetical protein [Aspergillus fischeri NRRL 181]EAW15987.1 conserved hypothetical protein [Aspergillus fischeri NRRL 181]KAG2025751.1 hypothetical protein GB937_002473 [Aspergillus fischeri]
MARTSSVRRRRDPPRRQSRAPSPPPPPSTASEQSVETEWKEIACHTAKCDMCNTRNGTGMSRCEGCGWQACYKCILANGCSRTHRGNGRVHTGAIDQTLIARMRRGRATVKREADDAGQLRRQSSNLKRMKKEESSSKIPSAADDEVLNAARNFLAFSIEAIGLAIQEDGFDREHSPGGAAHRDEDVANFMSMTSRELHDYAQQQASHALQAYLERRARETDAPEIGTFSGTQANVDETTSSENSKG